MYGVLLEAAFMGSLALMAYLLARALPRIDAQEPAPSLYRAVDSMLAKIPLHRLDDTLHAAAIKWLKRFRLAILKLDNRVARHIDRMKAHGERVAQSPSKELIEHIGGNGASADDDTKPVS
jgi:hypothetical protein